MFEKLIQRTMVQVRPVPSQATIFVPDVVGFLTHDISLQKGFVVEGFREYFEYEPITEIKKDNDLTFRFKLTTGLELSLHILHENRK